MEWLGPLGEPRLPFLVGLHIPGGVDEIDTQRSQETLGNRGSPRFFIDFL